ncbi:MAG: glycosyltransferase family 2 protein [Chloroflexi bacterium]|nr:glycosyltransferase family 2 protein [Chloroflexota bacterium]
MSTVIIMPAHNEAENLPVVLPELRRHLPDTAIVVIDDYSSDDTAAVATRLGAHVVSLPCNLGYGGAVQTGFKYAVERGYDHAVMMDADGQHDPASVARLLVPVLAGEFDVAVGSRFLPTQEGAGEVYHAPWARRLGMRLFGAIVEHYAGRRITDPTSGFQALNREALAFFARDNYPTDYPDADTLLLLSLAGFRVTEVPVHMRQRLAGVSMHASWKVFYYVFKMLLAVLMVLLRDRTRVGAHRRAQPPSPAAQG